MSAIEFRHVSRVFADVRAVDDVSFAIEPGEFFAMLGPSGSGKTTSLRLIAGFDAPSSGQILLDGENVASVPPYDRNVNTVFQDYALFPHMTVAENVAYGPRVRGVRSAERGALAKEMLELVQLGDLAQRRPAQLSGGQRQRVALARALINRPRVLLLDEPLGALDLKLREEMQIELKTLQRKLALTFVYVTHDQGEALSMADRVAVFNRGRIEQLAAPRELYARPRTPFVARFVGGANVATAVQAEMFGEPGHAFAVRAENISVHDERTLKPAGAVAAGELVAVQFHGAVSRWQVKLDAGGETWSAIVAEDESLPLAGLAVGARVRLSWPRTAAVPLSDASTA